MRNNKSSGYIATVLAARLRQHRRRAAAGFLPCLLLFAIWCAAQSSDEPLGDLARQNKPAHKAAHVVTNDEIPSAATPVKESDSSSQGATSLSETDDSAAGPSSPISQSSTGKPSTTSKSGITVPGLLTNGTLAQARAVLEGLKHDRQALVNNYDKIENKLAETNDDSLRRVYSDSLARRNETLARTDKAIADTESAIHRAESTDTQGGKDETQ